MTHEFYPSGYNMGEEWPAEQQWSSSQQTTPPQYSVQSTAPSQPYDPSQYDASQYNASQYGYGQQQGAQQQSFYSTPQQQDFYATPQTNQNYSNNSNIAQPAVNIAQPAVNDDSFYTSSSTGNTSGGSNFYNPNMGTMGSGGADGLHTSDSFEDEPPLMEELGIDLQQIYQTTMTVLNPSKPAATTLMDDPDLSGPLMFCLAFGSLLLLSGKIHFGYIYGVALVGAVAMYFLLNLMSVNGVSVSVTVSVLGYCMLPMCVLAGISALLSLNGTFGVVLSGLTVSWAAFASSKLFVSVLAMYDQQPLVAYPCAIMYGIFAVLTVF